MELVSCAALICPSKQIDTDKAKENLSTLTLCVCKNKQVLI